MSLAAYVAGALTRLPLSQALVAGERRERAALELQPVLPGRHGLELVEPGRVAEHAALDLRDALALERPREGLERRRGHAEHVALVGARGEAGVAEAAEVEVAVQRRPPALTGTSGAYSSVEKRWSDAPVHDRGRAGHELEVGRRREPASTG